jgi:hypothetical protein
MYGGFPAARALPTWQTGDVAALLWWWRIARAGRGVRVCMIDGLRVRFCSYLCAFVHVCFTRSRKHASVGD